MLKNDISLSYMIYFSPAKINLGLQIIERRGDGFHNLRSVMYPIPLYDIIEISQLPGQDSPMNFSQSGTGTNGKLEKNLCVRAWELMAADLALPAVSIHLHKQIPVGAGLGGGSSNASTVLMGLNALANSPASPEKLVELAGQLGSDCPFFLQKLPMMMEGRGELLSEVDVSLNSLYLLILFPEIHISTAEAYSAVSPFMPDMHLRQLIQVPVNQWKERVINDFEKNTFIRYPRLKTLKLALYKAGAIYASMSGSGSSLYGIVKTSPQLPAEIQKQVIWEGKV
jgi:4-diphosphocytidyl-2-C-methyl-D-erythritol kinase